MLPPRSTHSNNGYPNRKGDEPDIKKVMHDLSRACLHDADTAAADNPLLDVQLLCNDNVSLHANNAILCMRSTFFHTLLFSAFREADTSTVELPMSSHTLREVLHYLHTEDTPLVRKFFHSLNDSSDLYEQVNELKPFVSDLLSLAVAADYLQLVSLQQMVCILFSRLCDNHRVDFEILELVLARREDALRFCDAHAAVTRLLASPCESFDVPDVLEHPSKASGRCKATSLLLLSELSMGYLGEIIENRPGVLRGDTGMEMFQVLYCWATRGCIVPRCVTEGCKPFQEADVSGDMETGVRIHAAPSEMEQVNSSSDMGLNEKGEDMAPEEAPVNGKADRKGIEELKRWEVARAVTSKLNVSEFDVRFVVEYVENSGLVTADVILGLYRAGVTRRPCERGGMNRGGRRF